MTTCTKDQLTKNPDNNPSQAFAMMQQINLWHEGDLLETVTELLKLAVDDEKGGYPTNPKAWSWLNNNRSVKYITIKIDMRDGGYLLLDREGKRISLDQIKWQWRS